MSVCLCNKLSTRTLTHRSKGDTTLVLLSNNNIRLGLVEPNTEAFKFSFDDSSMSDRLCGVKNDENLHKT